MKSELVFPLGVWWFVWAAVTNVMKEMLLTTGVYRPTVLEARSLKVQCCLGWFLLRAGREASAPGHSPAILVAVFMCTWHPP